MHCNSKVETSRTVTQLDNGAVQETRRHYDWLAGKGQ